MITKEQIPTVLGHTAYDTTHNKIGTIGQIYVDDQTGQPEWMTVHTGLFGTKETFVPLEPAQVEGDEVIVPFGKEQIKDAPTVETQFDGRLSDEEEARLYAYYGMAYPMTATPTTPTEPAPARAVDDAMTRSEERMRVGKETRESGRAYLRKYVVTEEQQHTIPVRREEVRLEREPITEENFDAAMAGPEITEAEHEAILHEERPVVETETVPVERVRLTKDTVTEEETVAGEVRKERIEHEHRRSS